MNDSGRNTRRWFHAGLKVSLFACCLALAGVTPAAAMTLPGAPTNVFITPYGIVSWAAPHSDGGSPILEYDIVWCTGSEVNDLAPSLMTVSLPAGLGCSVRARARNAFGWGPWSPWSPGITARAYAGAGYWMIDSTGFVSGFGDAIPESDFAHNPPTAISGRDIGRALPAGGQCDWITNAVGQVSAHLLATNEVVSPKLPALVSGEAITTIAGTPTCRGYWLFSSQGRVFPYGDARSYGDLSRLRLNRPIVASTATPSGRGYYMVGADGGIFCFGDAHFHGSTGGIRLNRPVVGISPTPDGRGYWLVASDGGMFAFRAPFRGSLGATRLNKPIVGAVAYGNGYLLVASDGGIFNFSNRAFLGSFGGRYTPPIIGIAAFST